MQIVKHILEVNNTTTTSQCGSRFRGVWEDPDVGNFTSNGMTAR